MSQITSPIVRQQKLIDFISQCNEMRTIWLFLDGGCNCEGKYILTTFNVTTQKRKKRNEKLITDTTIICIVATTKLVS